MSAGFIGFDTVGGDFMAYSKQGGVPWHGLGAALPGLATAEEMILAAKQDWKVECRRLSYQKGDGNFYEAPAFATVRVDSEELLGVVGTRYTPVQNTSLFSFFDNLVEEKEAIYETAGSLHGGKKVWVLAKLPQEQVIWRNGQPDTTLQYILLCNSHDGSQSLRVYFTPVRVVCQNTLTASAGQASNRVSIRHTLTAEDRLKEAHKLMGFATKYYDEVSQVQEFLASQEINDIDLLLQFFEEIWPDTAAEKSRAHQKRATGLTNFREECNRYGSDWLSALNAATGVVDHDIKSLSPGKEDLRMDKILFGVGADLKEKAFATALKFSGYNKE